MMKPEDYLGQGEVIVYRTKLSKVAIIGLWVSIPALLVVLLCSTILPGVIALYRKVNSDINLLNKVLKYTGQKEISLNAIVSYLFYEKFGALAKFLRGVMWFFTTLLLVTWLIFCLIKTKQNACDSLVTTDKDKMVCITGKKTTTSYLKDIKNVFIERPIWGKIFRFANVTVSIEGQSSVTIKNVCFPEEVKTKLTEKSEFFYK